MNSKIWFIIAVVGLIIMGNPFYILTEGKQAVITLWGEPRRTVTESGLKLKVPFFEKVNKFEKRILEWDGYPSQIPTLDKKYIWVDTTARWKVVNALKFFKSVSNESGAQSILDGIIDAAVRDAVTAQNLFELVRTSNRIINQREELEKTHEFLAEGALETITIGRDSIRKEIIERARQDLGERYGIELIDVQVKRVNYVEEVRTKAYERMIAERRRAAEQYRSEGRGVRADVQGRTEKELKAILSQAYKESQKIKGEGDAESTKIYAQAYSKDPELFAFLKTLETYKDTIDGDTTVILTTDGDYFKYLKEISP